MLDKIALEGSKILIIDQSENDIWTLQNIFLPEKYVIGVISEPITDVINIITTSKPDLILLDLHSNGIELCKQLQQHDTAKNIPVILIAEHAELYEIANAFNSGVIDYINKPFQIEEVKSRIRTNLKNAKLSKELVTSKLESECILSAIVDGIISLNSKGKIVYFNKIAENMFGLNAHNISRFLEVPYIQLSHNDKELELLELVETSLLNNIILKIHRGTELTNMHGQTYLVKGTVSPTYNDRMRAIGVLIVIQDVTEQIQLEKTLQHAEKISTLGTFAAGFAHEINNPLSAIIHGVKNIKRQLDPNVKKNKTVAETHNINLNNVHEYVQKMDIMQILDGMLEVSIRASHIIRNIMRLDINKSYLGCKENINTIINERLTKVTAEKNDLLKANDIHFAVNLDNDLPPITCVKNDIDFVILSLLNNAIDAIIENKIGKNSIEIKSYYTEQHVYFKICNFGKKIPSKVITHMFDPFYTSTPSRTGLGLFLSYFIIATKHNGSFQYLHEHKHEQNTFTISLPL